MNRFIVILTLLLVGMPAMCRNAGDGGRVFTPAHKLQFVEDLIRRFYFEEVKTDTIVDEAIRAMLKTLDPHSVYSDVEETAKFTEPLTGNFSGIGVSFNLLTDTLYVLSTISGGPAERVGILPGDRIVEVEDTVIAGVKIKEHRVKSMLRGPKGTRVNLKVKRGNQPELIDFRITRDDIPIYSVDASYMVDPEVGYIRVSRFSETTGDEFKKALDGLMHKGMKRLIIDVTNNGGGYLSSAVDIASHLLDRGQTVVYTEGLHSPYHEYVTHGVSPLFSGPVAVMVNQNSASASEILAGAIQDYDRGVVVGRRTYGKGLVQRPFPFPDGSMMRLTTAKYFTPSGRSIQKPYTRGNNTEYHKDIRERLDAGELMHGDSIHVADSLRYTTLRNKRVVYGGGGIIPDRFVALDTMWYTPYATKLLAKGVYALFVQGYLDGHRNELHKRFPTEATFIEGFEVDDEMLDSLLHRGVAEGVEINEEEFARSRDYIANTVKVLLARDLYDTTASYKVSNATDPLYIETVRLIHDMDEYNKLLSQPK